MPLGLKSLYIAGAVLALISFALERPHRHSSHPVPQTGVEDGKH